MTARGAVMPLRGRSAAQEEALWFITTTIVSFTKVFTEERYFRIAIDNLKFYREKYKFLLLGYVIMPEHVHFLLYSFPNLGRISDIMRDWKWSTAFDIKEQCLNDGRDKLLDEFQLNAKRNGRNGYQIWMPRFDDVLIYSKNQFEIKLNYIHSNPVKRGLVDRPEDWLYSSARNYLLGDHSIMRVDTDIDLAFAAQ
jgi:putative transposase